MLPSRAAAAASSGASRCLLTDHLAADLWLSVLPLLDIPSRVRLFRCNRWFHTCPCMDLASPRSWPSTLDFSETRRFCRLSSGLTSLNDNDSGACTGTGAASLASEVPSGEVERKHLHREVELRKRMDDIRCELDQLPKWGCFSPHKFELSNLTLGRWMSVSETAGWFENFCGLSQLDISLAPQLERRDIALLQQCTALTSLCMNGGAETSYVFGHVILSGLQMPQLRRFTWASQPWPCTDEITAALPTLCPNLTTLSLFNCRHSTSGFQQLSRLVFLKSLFLEGSPLKTRQSVPIEPPRTPNDFYCFSALARLSPHLQSLSLCQYALRETLSPRWIPFVMDAHLNHLMGRTALTTLVVSEVPCVPLSLESSSSAAAAGMVGASAWLSGGVALPLASTTPSLRSRLSNTRRSTLDGPQFQDSVLLWKILTPTHFPALKSLALDTPRVKNDDFALFAHSLLSSLILFSHSASPHRSGHSLGQGLFAHLFHQTRLGNCHLKHIAVTFRTACPRAQTPLWCLQTQHHVTVSCLSSFAFDSLTGDLKLKLMP